MKNENFAERLFCDLKNADVIIENPQYVFEGAKIGQFENTFQFNIIGIDGKYKSSKGPISLVDIEGGVTFTQAYSELFEQIKSLKHVKFYSLVVPKKAVVKAELEEFEKVISRYIQDYLPMIDSIGERWDVMVQKI